MGSFSIKYKWQNILVDEIIVNGKVVFVVKLPEGPIQMFRDTVRNSWMSDKPAPELVETLADLIEAAHSK
jgi:hypothetical protein